MLKLIQLHVFVSVEHIKEWAFVMFKSEVTKVTIISHFLCEKLITFFTKPVAKKSGISAALQLTSHMGLHLKQCTISVDTLTSPNTHSATQLSPLAHRKDVEQYFRRCEFTQWMDNVPLTFPFTFCNLQRTLCFDLLTLRTFPEQFWWGNTE